jgi:peptidoglycan/LPS O-acetylase OafA/YrhL
MDSRTYLHVLNALLIPIHNLPGVFEHNIYDATINGALWTMSVEFAAYCALALILVVSKYVFKNIRLQKKFHVLCFCVLFVMFVILDKVVGNDFLITVVRPFVIFFMGVLYCDFSEKIKLNFPLAFTMIFIMILACKMGFLNYTMIFFLPYIVVTLALGTKQLQINSKMLLLSYEMYLFGWPIQQAVVDCFGGQMNPWLNCFISVPIDIIFAYVLYVFVEKVDKKFL